MQLAKAPPLDLSKPVVAPLAPYRYSDHTNPAYYDLKEITFTKEGMQLKRYDEKSQIISPHDVARISYERFYGNPSFGAICHSLHLNEWHAFVGKKILFCASGASLATINQVFTARRAGQHALGIIPANSPSSTLPLTRLESRLRLLSTFDACTRGSKRLYPSR